MTWSSSSTNKSGGQYLELLCSELQEGTAVIDQSTGMVVFCNPAWLSMFGLSGSGDLHIAGLGQVRKHPLPAANWAGYLATAGNRATRYEDVEFIPRNGRSFHASCLIRTMKRNNQQMYMVVLNQTGIFTPTGWQTSQEKACLTAVLEHTDTGVIEVNQLTQIVEINTAALRLFGYTKQELMGRKIQALIPERLRYQYAGSSAASNLSGLKKSGEEFPVEIRLTNYTLDHQPYIIVFVTDISARKKNEQRVTRLNDQLEDTVERRTKELKSAVSQLQQSKEELYRSLQKEKELNELKSRFVSMASHEFRTPLSTVLSSAYLLEQYNTGAENLRQQRHIQRIVSSVNMLTDILNDFLSVSRIEEGKIHTRYQHFNVSEMTTAVLEEMKINFKTGQRTKYQHTGENVVMLDVSLFRHILMNLLSNASKFSAPDQSIEITTNVSADRLTLAVTDHGIGISPEDQQHLMERFFRGTNALAIQGTGLGLHIISKYAELMNGTITYKSSLNQGTTFTLSFTLNQTNHEKDPVD